MPVKRPILETIQGTACVVTNSTGTAPPRSAAPVGAIDAHMHIFDPRFPLVPGRSPDMGTVDDYLNFRRRLGLSRCVVSAPSSYGFDTSCLLDALARFGDSARGIVTLANDTPDPVLRKLDAAGVRGLRVNFGKVAGTQVEDIMVQAAMAERLGWHLEINMPAHELIDCEDLLRKVPVPVVLDHMGKVPQPGGVTHPVVDMFARLIDTGHIYVKLDFFYEFEGIMLDDYGPLVSRIAGFSPERTLWGSGWNHADRKCKPDDARVFDRLFDWVPDRQQTDRILVHNPQALYWRR